MSITVYRVTKATEQNNNTLSVSVMSQCKPQNIVHLPKLYVATRQLVGTFTNGTFSFTQENTTWV